MEINGIEWAAGLFEGEGSITCNKIKGRNNSYRTTVNIGSADKDVLDRFCKIIGVGQVLGPYKNKLKHRKDIYTWAVQNYRDCLFVIGQLYPYLGNRRKQKANEFIDVAINRWF